MTLADAMRKGAMQRPQCRGDWFKYDSYDSKSEPIATCALGAAWEGLLGPASREVVATEKAFYQTFGDVLNSAALHPKTSRSEPVSLIIASLNDQCRWTREKIADWLDTLPEERS